MTNPPSNDKPAIKPSERYKDTRDQYSKTLHRSTFAIKKELAIGLDQAVEAAGAGSVSGLLSALAMNPEAAGRALGDLVSAAKLQAEGSKSSKKALQKVINEAKGSGLTAAELEAAIQDAKKNKRKQS